MNGNVTLSFAGETASFRCQGDAVDVPRGWADHSRLLAEIREEDNSATDVPIPLSIETLKAWLAVVEATQKGPVASAGLSDTVLISALEVCLLAWASQQARLAFPVVEVFTGTSSIKVTSRGLCYCRGETVQAVRHCVRAGIDKTFARDAKVDWHT